MDAGVKISSLASFGWAEMNITAANNPTNNMTADIPPTTEYVNNPNNTASDPKEMLFDVMLFVSPEYAIHQIQAMIDAAKPQLVVIMVHNGDAPSIPLMRSLHTNLRVVALSPHVAA